MYESGGEAGDETVESPTVTPAAFPLPPGLTGYAQPGNPMALA